MSSNNLTRVSLTCAAVLAIAAPAAANNTITKVLKQGIDPATGAYVSVVRGINGQVGVTVETPDLVLRKHLAGERAITTIVADSAEITIEVDRSGLTVSGTAGRVEVTAQHHERMRDASAIIARSQAARLAASLLGRIKTSDASLARVLLSTRAMLLASTNDLNGMADLARWTEAARSRAAVARPGVTRIALQDSPTDCWNKYAAEAIAAYIEYEDCVNNLAWYQVLQAMACTAIYDMRALGAFSWYIGCVSFVA